MVIEIGNAVSYLRAETELIVKLQPLISYRQEILPPKWVQWEVKRWLGELQKHGSRRWGFENDLPRLYAAREGKILDHKGWSIDRWTKQMFEATCKQAGVWDGWRTLIGGDGSFGTGLIDSVQRALSLHLRLPEAALSDLRPACPRGSPFGSRPVLWDHQEKAVAAFLRLGRGVWDLPPRSGKTRASIAAIREVGVPTLVVVPRIELVNQTIAEMEPYFGSGAIGLTGGQSKATHKRQIATQQAPVWVATPKTALGLALETRRMLVIDEFHHAAADSYQQISRECRNAYWRLGMTGTFYRSDRKDPLMHAVLGEAIYSRSVADMVAGGFLAPGRAAMLKTDGEKDGKKVPDMEYRNALIAWAVQELMSRGCRVLVLCVEIRHVEKLAALIPGAIPVDGRDSSRVRPALDDLEARKALCVVGTSVIGEGIDVPAADAMVYAAGNRSRVKVVQDTFRVMTASSGKAYATVIDFTDAHSESGIQRAAERLSLYRQNGFEAVVLAPPQLASWLDGR